MIFAQYAPTFTAGELFAVVGILVFILFAVVLARKVFGHEPPLHKEYATKTDLREAHGRIGREREEIDRAFALARESRHALDAKVEAHRKELDLKLEQQTKEINTRIDAIPGRTIALLNETKQLHFGK